MLRNLLNQRGLGSRQARPAWARQPALLDYTRLRRLDDAAEVPADVLRLLLDVPLLAILPPRMVERLALDAESVTAQQGETVIAEGDAGDRFFVLDRGRVEVTL